MIIFVNGAFGVGKTSVARALSRRIPRSIIFNPEWIGIPLQRILRVDDFQDLAIWRRSTSFAVRLVQLAWPTVIVPMAFSNVAYLHEVRERAGTNIHVCLTARIETVRDRLKHRGGAGEWEYRRAEECCNAHQSADFEKKIATEHKTIEEIAAEIARMSE